MYVYTDAATPTDNMRYVANKAYNGGHNSLDCIFCLRPTRVNGHLIRPHRLETQSLTDRLV